MKIRKITRFLLSVFIAALLLIPTLTAAAAEDTLTVNVEVKNAEFNTAGFSLKYDPEVLEYKEESTPSEYTVFRREIDNEKGTAAIVMFVTPEGESPTVTADENGIVLATLTFNILDDGKTNLELSNIPDDVDFNDTPFFVLNEGYMKDEAQIVLTSGGKEITDLKASKVDTVMKNDPEIPLEPEEEPLGMGWLIGGGIAVILIAVIIIAVIKSKTKVKKHF